MALTPINAAEFQYVFTCPSPPTPYYQGQGLNDLARAATFDFSPLLALGSIAVIKYFTFNYSVLTHDTSGFNGVNLKVNALLNGHSVIWPWIVGTELYASGSGFYTASNLNFDLATDFQDQTAAVTAIESGGANIPTIQVPLPGYSVSCYYTNPAAVIPSNIVLFSTCQGYQTDIQKFLFEVQCEFSSQSRLSSFPNYYRMFYPTNIPPVVIVKNLIAWCEASSTPCGGSGPPPPPPPPGDKPDGRCPSHDVSDSRRHARAFVANQIEGTAAGVKFGLASNVLPVVWNQRSTGFIANAVSLRWDRQSTGSPVLILAENGNGITLYKSVNEGLTWTNTFVGSGKRPALLVARDGRRYCFYTSAGSIQCVVFDPSGKTIKAQFTCVTSGVDDDTIAADEFTLVASQWGITLVYLSGGKVTYRTSTDGGKVWSAAVTVGTGKHPAFFIGRDARRFFYWVSSTKILGKILNTDGTTSKDTFTAIDKGVDDKPISAEEFVLSETKWAASLLYSHGGAITTVTSNDGVKFAV